MWAIGGRALTLPFSSSPMWIFGTLSRYTEISKKEPGVTPVDTFSSYKGHMTIYAASFAAALTEPWLFPMP